MNQPPTPCSKCQQVVCTCAPASPTANQFQVSKHDYHKPWKKLYQSKRWRDLRDAILRRDPACKVCNRRGSTVADHIKDHRGNLQLFWDPNNLRGSCKPCHDERTGSEHGIGNRENEMPSGLDGNGRVIDNYGK